MMRRLGPAALALAVTLAAPARAAEPTLTLDLGGGQSLELVRIEPGAFTQGSPPGEPGRGEDETPREVTIRQGFYIGRFEVTRGQFGRFVAETGYRTEAEKGTSGGFGWDGKALVQGPQYTWRSPGFAQTDEHPVVIVTFDDALAFTRWLSAKARRTIALPSEAQWEYAARGGSQARFGGGASDADAAKLGWLKSNAGGGTRPVGQKAANGYGIHDTVGSVYEWCRDWYGPYPAGPAADPEETRSTLSDKPRRVLRGGSWLKEAKACRAAARYRNTPGSRNPDNGFRVLAALEPLPAAAAATAAPVRAPVRAEPTKGSAIAGGLLLGLPCCAGVGVLVLLALRRRGRSRRARGVRIAADVMAVPIVDGFWLKSRAATPGSQIRYKAIVDGETREGEVQVEPAISGQGQFVYTGGRPTAVEVIGVFSGIASAAEAIDAPRERERLERERAEREDRARDRAPVRGHPPAY